MTSGRDYDEVLDRLLPLMLEYNLDTLRIRQGDKSFTLTVPETCRQGKDVASPVTGVVMLRHPVQDAPLVRIGDRVSIGSVLALIGHGPLFSIVRAPEAGRVTRIVARQGAPIAAGEPLMTLG